MITEVAIPITKKEFFAFIVFEVDGSYFRLTPPLGSISMVQQKLGEDWQRHCTYDWKTNSLVARVFDQKIKVKPIFRK